MAFLPKRRYVLPEATMQKPMPHGMGFLFSGDYFTISWYSRSMVWSQSMMDKCWGQAASHAPH